MGYFLGPKKLVYFEEVNLKNKGFSEVYKVLFFF